MTWMRLPAAQKRYEAIGGGSPVVSLTRRQAEALGDALASLGMDAMVLPAMRYGKPSIGNALDQLREAGVERLVALPMYPQFSLATTGSCINELHRRIALDHAGEFSSTIIDRWPVLPGYVAALGEGIRAALSDVAEEIRENVVLLFSAHGLPESFIRRGDLYVDDTEMTVAAVLQEIGWQGEWRLAYQSLPRTREMDRPDDERNARRHGRRRAPGRGCDPPCRSSRRTSKRSTTSTSSFGKRPSALDFDTFPPDTRAERRVRRSSSDWLSLCGTRRGRPEASSTQPPT